MISLAVLPLHYLYWHYLLAWRDAWRLYGDVLWFVARFFSIIPSIKTWLSPWRRLGETYSGGLDPAAWFSAVIVNLLMRLVGAVARTALIVVGVLVWLLTLITGPAVGLIWLVLPPLVLVLLGVALYLLI